MEHFISGKREKDRFGKTAITGLQSKGDYNSLTAPVIGDTLFY